MLEEQLAQASHQASRLRIRIAILVVCAIAVAALFILGVVRLDFGFLQTKTATQAESTSPAPETLPDAPVPTDTTADTSAANDKPAQSSVTQNQQEEINTEQREEFKKNLDAYETLYAAKIDEPRFSAWNQLARDQIQADKQSALSAFAASEYAKANTKITLATEQAMAELQKRDAAYTNAFNEAKAAYDADNFDTAILKIEEALRLDPGADDAQTLKQKIDALPSVLDLINQAGIARIENDLEKEKALLEKVLAQAPERTASRERLNTVTQDIKEAQLAAYISSGFKHVEKRNLKSARESLTHAERIDRTRSETKLLREKVTTLKKEIDVEALVQSGIEESAADNWTIAFEKFNNAISIIPGNKNATDGRNLAYTILDLQSETARHLAAENRLAAENVRTEVKALIEKAKTFTSFSPILATQTADLEAKLKVYGQVVPVFIESDGLTEISVRTVGRVGKTTGRTISLKPGTYTLEGTRKGYRSKLVPIEVPAGSSKVSVEVICDERI